MRKLITSILVVVMILGVLPLPHTGSVSANTGIRDVNPSSSEAERQVMELFPTLESRQNGTPTTSTLGNYMITTLTIKTDTGHVDDMPGKATTLNRITNEKLRTYSNKRNNSVHRIYRQITLYEGLYRGGRWYQLPNNLDLRVMDDYVNKGFEYGQQSPELISLYDNKSDMYIGYALVMGKDTYVMFQQSALDVMSSMSFTFWYTVSTTGSEIIPYTLNEYSEEIKLSSTKDTHIYELPDVSAGRYPYDSYYSRLHSWGHTKVPSERSTRVDIEYDYNLDGEDSVRFIYQLNPIETNSKLFSIDGRGLYSLDSYNILDRMVATYGRNSLDLNMRDNNYITKGIAGLGWRHQWGIDDLTKPATMRLESKSKNGAWWANNEVTKSVKTLKYIPPVSVNSSLKETTGVNTEKLKEGDNLTLSYKVDYGNLGSMLGKYYYHKETVTPRLTLPPTIDNIVTLHYIEYVDGQEINRKSVPEYDLTGGKLPEGDALKYAIQGAGEYSVHYTIESRVTGTTKNRSTIDGQVEIAHKTRDGYSLDTYYIRDNIPLKYEGPKSSIKINEITSKVIGITGKKDVLLNIKYEYVGEDRDVHYIIRDTDTKEQYVQGFIKVTAGKGTKLQYLDMVGKEPGYKQNIEIIIDEQDGLKSLTPDIIVPARKGNHLNAHIKMDGGKLVVQEYRNTANRDGELYKEEKNTLTKHSKYNTNKETIQFDSEYEYVKNFNTGVLDVYTRTYNSKKPQEQGVVSGYAIKIPEIGRETTNDSNLEPNTTHGGGYVKLYDKLGEGYRDIHSDYTKNNEANIRKTLTGEYLLEGVTTYLKTTEDKIYTTYPQLSEEDKKNGAKIVRVTDGIITPMWLPVGEYTMEVTLRGVLPDYDFITVQVPVKITQQLLSTMNSTTKDIDKILIKPVDKK